MQRVHSYDGPPLTLDARRYARARVSLIANYNALTIECDNGTGSKSASRIG
jgi:hypothetical protein